MAKERKEAAENAETAASPQVGEGVPEAVETEAEVLQPVFDDEFIRSRRAARNAAGRARASVADEPMRGDIGERALRGRDAWEA